MGVYDCYGKDGVQLKIGPCELKQYNEGDKVDITDGIYIANEGVVIIHDGKLLATYEILYDKYGGILEPKGVWENPLIKIVKETVEQLEEESNEKANKVSEKELKQFLKTFEKMKVHGKLHGFTTVDEFYIFLKKI